MSTFGLIIPGRLVDTNFHQVDSNKSIITIPNADKINHIVVFLTGVVQLPPDVAACIFFSMPDPNASPTWNYLGYLSNDKPSAIYKFSNMTRQMNKSYPIDNITSHHMNGLAFNYTQAPVLHVAQIGISIEPLSQVQQMVPVLESAVSKSSSFSEFITKTVNNLYNYCSSFSRSFQEMQLLAATAQAGDSPSFRLTDGTQFVPLNTLKDWYENYTRRLSSDENFWKTLA